MRRVPNGYDSLWGVTYQSVGEGADGGIYEMGGGHYRGPGKLHYDWTTRYATDDYHPALGYYYNQSTYGASFDFGKSFSYEKGPLQGRFWRATSTTSPTCTAAVLPGPWSVATTHGSGAMAVIWALGCRAARSATTPVGT